MSNQFLIMTTSYNGPRKFLMGSKNKTLLIQRGQKWTRLLDLAAVFVDEEYAQQVASRFRFGEPTVVSMEQAEQYLGEDEELDGVLYAESVHNE